MKIEIYTAAVPVIESTSANKNASESGVSEKDAANEEISDINDEPEVDLAEEHSVVNIGDINESDDLPVEDENDTDIDVRPDTYHYRLRAKQTATAALIGDKVTRKSGGAEFIREVIDNHTKPEVSNEVSRAQKFHMKKHGYNNIKALL